MTERARTLRRLERDAGPLLSLCTDRIEGWLDSQQITLRSRRAYLSHFSAFYRWAVVAGHRLDDPTTSITAPKVPRKLPRPIGDDDLDMALRMASPRMRAWLLLACFEGLRCMEIAQLAREDVLDGRVPPLLRVLDGKGGKEAVLPLHPDVLAALMVFGMPPAGPVFVSSRGRPFAAATVSGYVASYLHGIGLHDTAHRLRDWFGTTVYADTHDLRLTQEVMRHSDPGSTAGYVAFNEPEAVAAVTNLRPASRIYQR